MRLHFANTLMVIVSLITVQDFALEFCFLLLSDSPSSVSLILVELRTASVSCHWSLQSV